MIKILVCLLGCFALASSIKNRRIMHGRIVSQERLMENFQFVVLVLLNCNREGICRGCTGSLFKPNEVLLAAHCLCDENGALLDWKKDIYVYLNSTIVGAGRMVYAYFGKMPREFDCSKTLSDDVEDFQGNIDLATIRLEEEVTDIVPVTLERENIADVFIRSRSVAMIGFGLNERNNSVYLRLGNTRTRDCDPQRHYPMVTGVYCVEANNPDNVVTHVGDSGGPLLVRSNRNSYGYIQIGVTQGRLHLRKIRCATNGRREEVDDHVGVYVKTADNYRWIMFDQSYLPIDVNKRKKKRKRRKLCCMS